MTPPLASSARGSACRVWHSSWFVCNTMPTMTARTVELQLPTAIAWDRIKTAATSLGKIEEAQENSRFLILKARYRLNPVRLRVSVLSGPSARRVAWTSKAGVRTFGVSRAAR